MDKKELLKIAKEKYPVGTVIISPYSKDTFEIIGKEFKLNQHNNIHVLDNGAYAPYVYYNNKWAEIISSPVKSYELW